MKYFVIVFLSMLALSSCQSDDKLEIKSNSEKLVVVCGKQIDFVLKNTDKVVIAPNSFDCGGLDSFELTINYVKTKAEIILSGFQTMDTDGNLLESAGMIQFDFPENVKINRKEPILFKSNSNYSNPDMNAYVLSEKTNQWQLRDGEIEKLGTEEIELGETLFKEHCRNCHNSTQLDADGTGPALGRVEQFRDMDWLIKFTQNSQKVIGQRDSLALCLFNVWHGSVMNSFEHLDSSEILSIYKFIQNESELQKINVDSMAINFDCEISYRHLRRGFLRDSLDRVKRDSISNNINRVLQSDNYEYVVKIYSSEWFNVDYILEPTIEITTPILQITGRTKGNYIYALLTFENSNTVIRFQSYEEEQFFLANSQGKEKIGWFDDNIYIIITEFDKNGIMKKGKILKHRFVEGNNNLDITIEDMSAKQLNEQLSKFLK